ELGGDRRLLRGAEPRFAHGRQRALCLAARGLRFPETLKRHRRVAGRGAEARQACRGARRRRRAERPRPLGADEIQMSPEELVRPEILALTAYAVPEAQGMVKLDAMENPCSLPSELRRELAEALSRVDLNRYPEPSARRVRELIARRMHLPSGMQLLLGNG